MRTLSVNSTFLLIIDVQSRLMPSIEDAGSVLTETKRLHDIATALEIPVLLTEQNSKGLGETVPELITDANNVVIQKMTFDACRTPGFIEQLPDRSDVIVVGAEAHVCVLQTVLGLMDNGFHVCVARDALGSRRAENKEAAIRRMERHGAEIMTVEMIGFELLTSAEHPHFDEVLHLIK